MKDFYCLIFFSLLIATGLQAQKNSPVVRFKNGDFIATHNIQKGKLLREIPLSDHFHKKIFSLLQFDKLPDENDRKELAAQGILLCDYVAGNAYLAELPENFSPDYLKNYHVTGLFHVGKEYKISDKINSYALENSADPQMAIAVSYFGSMNRQEVAKQLEWLGAKLLNTKINPPNTIYIKATSQVLQNLANLPFVSYISGQKLKDVPLNYNNHAFHGVDALASFSGRNLSGANITVGVGDNADPSTHVDFTGRLILRTPNPVDVHGTHTAGTVGGGGILNPLYKGMAPMSTLVIQSFSDILINTPTYVQDNNMVITNNSYYSGADDCPGEGEYNSLSIFADNQMYTYDSVLHVFACGNDGQLSCSPFTAPYGTIKSGFQCAKNVLAVGAYNTSIYRLTVFSSAGPVNDGRIKPEILAGGKGIMSTIPYNQYGLNSGTSMASPTVAGIVALLYQRYKQLHGGQNPSSALIKALVCNTADDWGNPGPDFGNGFGILNARRSVEAMEAQQYFFGNISNGANDSYTLNVPGPSQQLKIMLYWNDPAASPNASKALVNDLDLTVTEPGGAITHLPLILNPNPNHVTDIAVEGVDTLNNIEQVTINNPPAGNFTIKVNGTNVPQGPQKYVVSYDIVNPSVLLAYPFGDETWVPGETENIRWNAYGGDPNTFTIEFSSDNGGTWTTIGSNIASDVRSFQWTVPAIATNQAKIRVTRNVANYTDVSHSSFTILGQPVITVNSPCQGYANLIWNTVPSATSYEIMMLKGDSMQTIATTTDTSFLLAGLNRSTLYWLTVRSLNGTTAGRRGIAVSVIPNTNPCSLSSNDFTVDSLIAPITGRQHSSSQLSSNSKLTIELKNLGSLSSVGNIPVSYQVNGGTVVTENIALPIASNSTYSYSFVAPYDFSAVGTYTIKTWVSYPLDTLHLNDTLITTIKSLSNDTILLNPNFIEGFESATVGTYYNNTMGFDGLDRFDFNASTPNGRARTFVNTGFARTGNRSATLDQQSWNTIPTADSLIATFNLAKYSSADQIWLNYYYRNQGIDFSLPGNIVWIRGNDQAAWIPVDTLSILPNTIGIYSPSKNIDVNATLASAVPAQSLSSSFQVKFGEQGYTSANSVITDADIDNGYTFDDITFTKSVNDVGMVSLVTPSINALCNLSNAELVQVKVKNYTSTPITNVEVGYQINGAIVREVIPSIPPNDTLTYTFTKTADLSAYQRYIMSIWVHNVGDSYPNNDSITNINFYTTPIISAYPYLEGFEQSNGNWYTDGINDDWQWGHPQKQIINKAANGNNAWVTDLTGNYNDNERSYLYSPCFDLSSLAKPVLSFSHIFQMEDNCDCDYHWVEYSTDGINWIKLGTSGTSTNGYDNTTKMAWQKSDTLWHVSSFDIPTNAPKVKFRFAMFSDPATNYEGVGIDDIHVFDKASVYSGPSVVSGLTQAVSGNNWVNFTVGGNMVAAINPNGQDLGNTKVNLYIHDSTIRNISHQYYLNRNIVVQPSNAPTDSVSVRFYFLDTEADSLIQAMGCATCTTIHDAYESGVTQYSKDPSNEDSSFLNNEFGVYRFIQPRSQVAIIPNDNGYYAEYKVAGFSEFWINGGGPSKSMPLAALLQNFVVAKTDSAHALAQWMIYNAVPVKSFIVQKSFDSLNFTNFYTVNYSPGNLSYQWMDSLWVGINYYRLIIIDSNGNTTYTPVQSLTRASDLVNNIQVYPIPVSDGILNIKTPENCRILQLYDELGRTVLLKNTSGLSNTLVLPNRLPKGMYFLTVITNNEIQTFKIYYE